MQAEGIDRSLELFAQRALGFALNDERMGKPSGDPMHTFGHGGAGTLHLAGPTWTPGLAVGYITNGFRGADKNNARLAEVSASRP